MKIGLFVVLLLWACWSIWTLERRTLYYPDPHLAMTPAAQHLDFEELSLKGQDGVKIHGWFIPAPGKGTGLTLLFSHGNAGNISHRIDKVLMFQELGLDVLLYDYRGFGVSEGKPTEIGTYRDAETAYRYLTENRKIPAQKIVFYGESLGSAIAVETALHHPARALILESPFTSTVAMGKLVYPWLPVQWMVRYRYDTLAKLPGVHIPLLILHSPQDEIVPFAMSQTLIAAAHPPKKLVELTGSHNDGYQAVGRRYVDAIGAFLKGIS